MKREAPLTLLLTISLLLAGTITAVVSVSAQGYQEYTISIPNWGPSTAVKDQGTTLQVRVLLEGFPDGPRPATGSVTFSIAGTQIATETIDSSGWARTGWTFLGAGPYIIRADVQVPAIGASAYKQWSLSINSPATPTAQPTSQPTSTPAPTATPRTPTLTIPTTTPTTPPSVSVPPDSTYSGNLGGQGTVTSVTHTTSVNGNPLTTVTLQPNSAPSKQVTITDESVKTVTDGQLIFDAGVRDMLAKGWLTTGQGTIPNADSSLSYSWWYGQDSQGNFAKLWLRGSGVTNLEYAMPILGTPSVITAIEETVPGQSSGGLNLGMIGIFVAIIAVILVLLGYAVYRYRR